jgi:hypothetical protein
MSSRRSLVASLVAAAACALVAGAALQPDVAGATTRDDLMKTSLVALQSAVEQSGAARMYVYPHPKTVRPAGGLAIAFWPRDPWTGRRLTPGTTKGHYTYRRAKDERSYVLTGYLSGGRTFVVTGGMPHTPMLAYDHRGKEGLNLLFQYVEMWSRSHAGRLPVAAQVTRDGSVGRQEGGLLWPSNPWDHGAMAQRADRGSFGYVRAADGGSFTLTLHQALKGDYVLTGTAVRSATKDRR